MNETDARKALCDACSRLYGKDLLVSAGGNLSVRIDDGILITPSGRNKGSLLPDDIVKMNMNGKVAGKGKPSIEYKFHISLYNLRNDTNAIVHCHPIYCTAIAVRGEKIRTDLTPEGVILLGDVPMVPYCTPGSDELVQEIEKISKFSAAIMENHGAVTQGKTLEEACNRMEELEFQAHLNLVVGKVAGLTREEVYKLRRM
ncbi:MAG: class II aldolase/adducin family protein [Methanomassiliicoccaceae archaeon]|jgi:L-fuculose-phosphate aldolase|nr:class II aldolase/adducin family protein [Methanomassiliicoccaceae archaeon]